MLAFFKLKDTRMNISTFLLIFLTLGIFTTTVHADNSFKLNSSAAVYGAKMPAIYTCDGQDISPPLNWQGVPAGTQGFALLVTDPDDPHGTFTHWVVYNIPKSITNLDENATLPIGTMSGLNSGGKLAYYGPCPPAGPIHHYIFTLYALKAMLPVNTRATADVFGL
jgi:Raf kinase inhibitor-like YbhB/YbcL family protein